jgi:L-alanine-DL-glutamate epimerase-like enolase superfamily enzyme
LTKGGGGTRRGSIMRISHTEILVLGDARPPEPVDDWVEGRAFVRIHTDLGVVGLAELFAVPPGVAKAVLDGPDSLFGQLLAGEDVVTPERLRAKLYGSLMHASRRGWAAMCVGAAEVALWDLYGKLLGRPVWQLLGGAERATWQSVGDARVQEVTPYCTIVSAGWDNGSVPADRLIHEQLEKVVAVGDAGFRAVKVEPLRSTPATVVELARRAREALGPERALAVDVGYLWNDVPTALRVAEQLAAFDVLFLETPFPVDALEAYAALAARSPVPLAAGEHAVTRYEFRDLLERGHVLVAQPYATTCGGLCEALRVIELAQAHGALVCPGNWGTDVLAAATVHLAAVSPITPLYEYVPAQIYWSPLRKALRELGLPVRRGAVALPERPGIGVELSDDVVAHFRVG